jgi:ABC-2 type transport system permease protein
MRQFWEVFWYTFKDKVFSKLFLVSTLLIIVAEILILSVPKIQKAFMEKENPKIIVVEYGDVYHFTNKILNKSIGGYTWYVKGPKDIELLKKKLKDGKVDGMFIIKGGKDSKIIYYTNVEDNKLKSIFGTFLQNINTVKSMQEHQLSAQDIQKILQPIEIKTVLVSNNKIEAIAVVYAMALFTYIGTLAYGQSIATAITSEKSSRVMEVMITKVSPLRMMFGKIFSVGVASLLQLGIAVVSAYLLTKSRLADGNTNVFGVDFSFNSLSSEQIFYFATFFILGYFVYASIYATLGALVSRTEDLTTITMPVAMIIIFSFILSLYSLYSPNSLLAKILSFIPFSSSIAMFIRITLAGVPVYQIWLSILILIVFIVLFSFFAAKIYPSSVLNYSNKISLKQAIAMSKNKNGYIKA